MTVHEIKPAPKSMPDVQDRSRLRGHELFARCRRAPRSAFAIMAFLLLMSIVVGGRVLAAEPTPVAQVKSIAFLGVQFLNDHEAQEPTTDAERARLVSIEELFKSKLEASGRYKFVQIPADTKAKIARGAAMGNCGGCEVGYGEQLHSDLVAWVVVQKVSNLILNLNVYVADVATKKMTFIQSVDIRGNTDESWMRGMTYIVKNHMLGDRPL
ncbi:DUF3280 domain-containing protein [Rhodoblastus acidophilus]|uniref:DUF3280 domain-containing protein n=1 Tax=Candidatus Rhodoblastus alkanivorans TaxID=2954117 RepID=A0ABS9ZBL6_9HYPH|nr:DUF3280 domain-containing protein [Candidatus Rhodoblastus alkanivorans]MCI4680632.1 DUF3280 domain-containing protein [Candidatus Rhodoblastus alkanivorans]MCI4685038.1 DUF3280 domain-containing protein [Candidatus Rhodoblastus alkanivorans]MDI4643317.1 DUF3280 domain-containing protein [Rhodoblastus acidophilus]